MERMHSWEPLSKCDEVGNEPKQDHFKNKLNLCFRSGHTHGPTVWKAALVLWPLLLSLKDKLTSDLTAERSVTT